MIIRQGYHNGVDCSYQPRKKKKKKKEENKERKKKGGGVGKFLRDKNLFGGFASHLNKIKV